MGTFLSRIFGGGKVLEEPAFDEINHQFQDGEPVFELNDDNFVEDANIGDEENIEENVPNQDEGAENAEINDNVQGGKVMLSK